VAEPEYRIDFPTLFVAADWIGAHCIVPDGFDKGEAFELVDWQLWALLNFYRLRPKAKRGELAPAFHYRRSQIVLPQKAGKAPYTAAHICVEGIGPVLFAGWAKGGEIWDCRDHGCGCGWVHEYEPGEAMGAPWPTPLIQITATSEEQTENIYDALRPMIDDGPLSELIPRTGEEFIRLPNKGRIDVVTSNARSRLGQRVTFVPQDETGLWTPRSGMVKVAETQRRGLAGMGGRAEETTNAWDPAEGSVAQRTAEAKSADIFRLHPLPPSTLSYGNKAERRKIHRIVYQGCRWVDPNAIEAEAAEILQNDPQQAERFFGNRAVAGKAKAFDAEKHAGLATDLGGIAAGRLVVLGFDGALFYDGTGLVATDVELGHQVVVDYWERPLDLAEEEAWQVPIAELNEAVEFAFDHWDIWRMNGDPPHYREDLARWAGQYGEEKVVEFWTNQRKKTGHALKTFKQDMRPEVMSHGPLNDSEEASRDHEQLLRHIRNAVKRPTNIRDEEDGTFLWLIGKEGQKSVNRIDLAMAACLSWEGRLAAIRSGALDEPEYQTAQWG